MPRRRPTRPTPRRGAALLAALSVLVILTILVSALAASLTMTRQTGAITRDHARLASASRTALEWAEARLADQPATATLSTDFTELPPALSSAESLRYALRRTTPDNEIYGGGFLAHRPGDTLVLVQAVGSRATLGEKFLVNPLSQRRIRLRADLGQKTPTPGPARED